MTQTLLCPGCTGKRSRSTFRKVSDFDEQQLLADIRFMEDIEREFGSARRREPLKQPAILPRLLQELRQEVHSLVLVQNQNGLSLYGQEGPACEKNVLLAWSMSMAEQTAKNCLITRPAAV